MERREDVPPLLVGTQVVQDRSGQHDVELPVRQLDLPDVALDGRDAASGRPADPLPGPVEHRLAQVDQGGVEVRQALQQLEGVVAGPAAHVEDVPGVRRRGRCRLGDQRHRQRRIDRGRLAGFEVGEPLHVGVEPLPDFIDRRFHHFLPISPGLWAWRTTP